MRSILSSRNNRAFSLLLLTGLFIFACCFIASPEVGFAGIKEGLLQPNQPGNPFPDSELGGTGIKTFWSLTKLGGGISVAIAFVFALGVFLIVMQLYQLSVDKIRSRALLSTNYHQVSIGEVTKLVKKNPTSYAGRLYSILISIFQTTGNTQDFHDEIANYVELQQDRFATFRGRLSFLSDTAGALGLLGTVWGMFATFFGGNLDSQRILNGMGLALVTTLIGLVVSIILNFFATEVFSVFNKRMEQLSSKADEFRLWLMALVHQRNKKSGGGSGPANGSSTGSRKEPMASSTPAARQKVSAADVHLKSVSEFKQEGFIGQNVSAPIKVFVESSGGNRVAGVPVQFEILQGSGLFDNRSHTAVIQTDARGFAAVNWTLGEQVGPQRMRAYIVNNETDPLEFMALAHPFIPNLENPKDLRSGRAANPGVA